MRGFKSLFYIVFGITVNWQGNTCYAQRLLSDEGKSDLTRNTATFAGSFFNLSYEPKDFIKTVLQAFLGLLGVIFIILIIYAGFTWMTAGGEEEKVRKSKETMKRAVIGLIIIMAAYAITAFVFKSLPGGTGTGVGGPGTGS